MRAAGVGPSRSPGSQLIGLLPSLIVGDAANDFNTAMVSQLSTYPGGSWAGGSSFTFNPPTQAFARNSDSLGPSFADRAMTMGRDTFNVGAQIEAAHPALAKEALALVSSNPCRKCLSVCHYA